MVDLITMLLAFTVGSLLTLLAYTKGLQHNYQIKHDIEPKIENPIVKIVETKQQERQEKETKTIMDEWLNGE